MSKKSWHLDRRTFLKGLGVTCMLPYFEAMSMTNFSKLSEPEIAKRLCFLLKQDDPLLKKIKLSRIDLIVCFIKGIVLN